MSRFIKFIFITALFVFGTSAAHAQSNNCTVVGAGATVDVTGPNGVCKRIVNSGGVAACAMTGNSTMWVEFYTKGMPNLTISACPSSCGGYSYGGYCYRTGAASASCDTICGSYGGCNLTGTRAIGSSGTNAACLAVMDGVGAGPGAGATVSDSTTSGGDAGYDALGCAAYYYCYKGCSTIRYRIFPSATTCGALYTNYIRICACAN